MLIKIDDVVKIFEKLSEHSIDKANSFLLAYIQLVIHMYEAGVFDKKELQEYIIRLRESLLEVSDRVNPFINAVLGVLEEDLSDEAIAEALDRIRELWRMESLDKLEV